MADSGATGQQKSKAALRAERRVIQEAQRAAKAAKASGGPVKNPEQQQAKVKPPVETLQKKPEESQGAAKQSKPQQQRTTGDQETPTSAQQQQQQKKQKLPGNERPQSAGLSQRPVASTGTGLKQGSEAGISGGGSTGAGGTGVVTGSRPTSTPAAGESGSSQVHVPADVRMDDPAQQKKLSRIMQRRQLYRRPPEQRRVALFSHLAQYDRRCDVVGPTISLGASSWTIHPAFLCLGVAVDEGRISGSNVRCISFLRAVTHLLHSYTRPANVDFGRDFMHTLERHVAFIDQCRPLAVSIRTAVNFLKQVLNSLEKSSTDEECREEVLFQIRSFMEDHIDKAGVAIAQNAAGTIREHDCLLVFAHSSLVNQTLHNAWTTKPCSFRVIVADAPPRFEGRKTLAYLLELGVPCVYTHLAALPILMPQVTTVLVGTHALLSNGYVISRVGTGYLANLAAAFCKPVLFCCETYKFWERAQTDAFEYNELADPDDLVRASTELKPDWRQRLPNLSLLHLAYDVVSPQLASAVVTEQGILPTTSVPVVLRVKPVGL